MDIKPIKTEEDYDAAPARIEELWEARKGTPEFDELNILGILVEAYEEEHHPVHPPDPIEMLKFIMDQRGLTRKDLEPFLGHRGRVAEVINRRRALTLSQIRKLRSGLGVSADLLVTEYDLELKKDLSQT